MEVPLGVPLGVRWDAATSRNSFWLAAPAAAPAAAADTPSGSVEVRVWPFGILAGAGLPRPLTVNLAQGFTLSQVLDAVRSRYGAALLDDMFDDKGELNSHCRVCVDGDMVESLQAAVHCGPQANLEIILLVATEGG